MIISRKPYKENEYVKLGTYYFEIGKDYTYLGTILTIKTNSDQRMKKELRMQIEHIMHFYL
jgi:hypothetical protein